MEASFTWLQDWPASKRRRILLGAMGVLALVFLASCVIEPAFPGTLNGVTELSAPASFQENETPQQVAPSAVFLVGVAIILIAAAHIAGTGAVGS